MSRGEEERENKEEYGEEQRESVEKRRGVEHFLKDMRCIFIHVDKLTLN